MSPHLIRIAVAAVFTLLIINVWLRHGGAVLLILFCAGVGCVLAVFLPALVAGHAVVRHAQREQEAIRQITGTPQRKELTK